MNKRSKIALMKGLFSKMSTRLKMLDLLASISGTLSECISVSMYLFCALAINDGLNQIYNIGTSTGVPYYVWAIWAIVFGVLKGPMRYAEQYLNHNIAFHMLAEIRHYVYEALERLAPAKLEEKKNGDMLSLMTADIETLEVFYAHTLSPMLIALLSGLTIFIIGICFGAWQLSLIYLSFYLIIGILTPIISFKIIGNTGNKQRKRYAEFSAYFMESLDCTLPIVTTGKENEKLKEVDLKSKELNSSISEIKWKNGCQGRINELWLGLAGFVFAIMAIINVVNSDMNFIYPLLAILVMPGAFRPALALGALPGSLSNTFASADRFLNLIEEKPEVEERENNIKAGKLSELKIENLNYSYPDQKDKIVLRNINLTIPSNGIIGIKGPSGNGKSTLLNLIKHHRKVEDGTIYWNKSKIDEIDSNSLRQSIASMEQDTYLFKESLRDNMLEAKPDATDNEINQALERASISKLVDSLPNGLDTYIDNENLNISTGEKQRIGLARILLRNPNLILLDEPTSNVDSLTESIMLKTFKEISKEIPIVIVSHSESTLDIADKIYELKSGALEEAKSAKIHNI